MPAHASSSRVLPLMAAAAIAICGCTSDTPDATPATTSSDTPANDTTPTSTETDDTWKKIETAGFTVLMPSGWFYLQAAATDDAYLAEIASETPLSEDELRGLVDRLPGARPLGEGTEEVHMIKIDEVGQGEFASYVRIQQPKAYIDPLPPGLRDPADADKSDAEVLSETYASLAAEQGKNVTGTEVYTVSNTPAINVTYEGTSDVGDFAGVDSHLLVTEDDKIQAFYESAELDHELWRSVLETIVVTQ